MSKQSVKSLTEDELIQIKLNIQNCKSRNDFIQEYNEDYKKIKRRRLQRELLGHFPMKKREYWTQESIQLIANKYTTRTDFIYKDNSAYAAALRLNLLDDICSHMIDKNRSYGDKKFKKWLIKEVKRCKTRVFFCINNQSIYSHIMRDRKDLQYILKRLQINKTVTSSIGEQSLRKYLNLLLQTKFEKIKPSWLINPKTKRLLELDGLSYKLNIAFEHNSKYHDKKGYIDNQKQIQCEQRGIKLLVFNDILNEEKYKTIEELEQIIKDKLIKNNIKITNSLAKFVWVQSKQSSKWNINKFKKLIKKYLYLKDFIKENKGAYIAITRLRLTKKLLSKLIKTVNKSKYSDEFLLEKSSKYGSLNEFRRHDAKHYSAFNKRKHLKEAFKLSKKLPQI